MLLDNTDKVPVSLRTLMICPGGGGRDREAAVKMLLDNTDKVPVSLRTLWSARGGGGGGRGTERRPSRCYWIIQIRSL